MSISAPFINRPIGTTLLTVAVGLAVRDREGRTARKEQRERAARYADQMIFEGFVPGT